MAQTLGEYIKQLGKKRKTEKEQLTHIQHQLNATNFHTQDSPLKKKIKRPSELRDDARLSLWAAREEQREGLSPAATPSIYRNRQNRRK